MQDQPLLEVKHKLFFVWRVADDALLSFLNCLAFGIASAVSDALDVGIDGDKVSTFIIF